MDINYVAAETQGVALLTQHGPGVHRDLCHVVQHCSLGQMSSFRLPGEHPHGLFIYVRCCSWLQLNICSSSSACAEHHSSRADTTCVLLLPQVMQGRVQVRTRSHCKAALSTDNSKAEAGSKPAHGGSSGGARSDAAEGRSGAAGGASESDLRALFDSIDVDGSGESQAWLGNIF